MPGHFITWHRYLKYSTRTISHAWTLYSKTPYLKYSTWTISHAWTLYSVTPVFEIQYTDIISRPENVAPVLEISVHQYYLTAEHVTTWRCYLKFSTWTLPHVRTLYIMTPVLELKYLDITSRLDILHYDTGTWIKVPRQYLTSGHFITWHRYLK